MSLSTKGYNRTRFALKINCKQDDSNKLSPVTDHRCKLPSVEIKKFSATASTRIESPRSLNMNMSQTSSHSKCIYNDINLPESLTKNQVKIHDFLDQMQVNQINIKEYLESRSKISSLTVEHILQSEHRYEKPNLHARRQVFLELASAKENDEILGNIETIQEHHEEELDSKDHLISTPTNKVSASKSSLNLLANSLTLKRKPQRSTTFRTKNESLLRLKELELRFFESDTKQCEKDI